MRTSLLAFAAAGCGDKSGGTPGDMAHPGSDGHFQSGCMFDTDCDTGNKCITPHCVQKQCVNQQVTCTPPDVCNTSACDPGTGFCTNAATNPGGMCTVTGGAAGTCQGGTCVPIPSCFDPTSSFGTISCDNGSSRYADDANTLGNSSTTNQISTYQCATNETAPEIAYSFSSPIGGPVTVRLTVTGPPGGLDGGTPDAGAPFDADLDLIVLDGVCTSTATCVNPTLTGGKFQGITAGTGNETVTFTASVMHTYYIVVDGKNGAAANFHLEIQACGTCQPTPATQLACNMSMPVSGNTAQGTSKLSTYTCPPTLGGNVMAPGNEQTFLWQTTAAYPQPVRASVTGATNPVTLIALPIDFNEQCDPTQCISAKSSTAGSASVSFLAQPPTFGTVGAPYWIIIDTPAAGANATFGLQLACLPYCNNDSNATLACDTTTTRQALGNNGAAGSTRQVSAWGSNPSSMATACSGRVDLTGPEYVYLFTTPAGTTTPQQYTFSLLSKTAGQNLTLVVLKAGTTSPKGCDPNLACAVTAPVLPPSATSTGTYTTSGTTPAAVTLTADGAGANYYYIVVDGPGGNVADYALNVTGVGSSAFCP